MPLAPGNAVIGFRAYAFGLFPVDGAFGRFHGQLVADPGDPRTCHVEVTVETASLQMPSIALRDDVLSPSLLDASRFPTFAYSGDCQSGGIDGTLTLHGVSRNLPLAILRDASSYAAQASLRRADWGITGRPLMAGPTIRIRVSTTLAAQ